MKALNIFRLLMVQERTLKRTMIFILLGVLLASCSTARISQVYAFGDDFSDTGNYFKLIKEAVDEGTLPPEALANFEVNWQGRITNGPVAVEVLAEKLKVSLTSYAVIAAMSGHENINGDVPILENTGLLGQIDKFEAELNGKTADADALYFIQISGPDFMANYWFNGKQDNESLSALADQTIANITTAVTRLAKLGAKRFMVGNSTDLTTYPGIVREGLNSSSEIYQTRMNSRLSDEMKKIATQPNIKIDIFDFIAASDRIRSNPGQYGLTNLTDPCTQLPEEIGTVCANPDEYYFWGYFYLTRRVHQIMGEAMAEQITK